MINDHHHPFGSSADQPNASSQGPNPDEGPTPADKWISCTEGYSAAECGQPGVFWAAMRVRHLFERTPNRILTELIRSQACCAVANGRPLLVVVQADTTVLVCLDLERGYFLVPVLFSLGLQPFTSRGLRSPSGERIAVIGSDVTSAPAANCFFEELSQWLDRGYDDLRAVCLTLSKGK